MTSSVAASLQSITMGFGKQFCNTVHTEVLPLNSFTRAEDYHQKYLLGRRSELAMELKRIYPIHKDFVDSTAVARLNGYVGGNGSMAQLSSELEKLGLGLKSQQSLTEMVRRKGRRF